MNQLRSHPNHENRNIYEGPPPQGLCEARWAESFFKILVTDPPRNRPVGGGSIHPTNGERGSNPSIISEYYDFHSKYSITSWTLTGVSPPLLRLAWKMRYQLHRWYASIALSAAAVWGDCTVPSVTICDVFYLRKQGFLQSKKINRSGFKKR